MSIKARLKKVEDYFQAPAEQEPLFKKYHISSKKCIIAQAQRLPVYITKQLIYESIKLRDPNYVEVNIFELVMSESAEDAKKSQDRYKEALKKRASQPHKKVEPKPPPRNYLYTDDENDFIGLWFKANREGWDNLKIVGNSEMAMICYDNHIKKLPYFEYEKMSVKEFLSDTKEYCLNNV